MTELANLDPDDIPSYAPEVDPSTGDTTGGMIVVFKDGSEKRYRGDQLEKLLPVLQHVTPPTA